MRRLYKFLLTAGLCGIFGYGLYLMNSKKREELLSTEKRINNKLLQIEQRLNRVEEIFHRQITLIGILEQYDVNRDKIIDEEEYNRYLGDVLKIERVFKKYDTDSSNLLNREELYKLLKDYMSNYGVNKRISIEEALNHVLKRYDKDRDNLLNRVELIKLIHDYEEVIPYKF